MPGDLYGADQIVNKTLVAKRQVPVYRFPADNQKSFGSVATGQPVGVVYAWIAPNPAENRSGLWWQFYDATNKTYYAPHNENWYSIDALKQQGVLSTQEIIDAEKEKEDLENLPWYERLLKKYGVWVLGAVVVSAAVKGYLSRPTKN